MNFLKMFIMGLLIRIVILGNRVVDIRVWVLNVIFICRDIVFWNVKGKSFKDINYIIYLKEKY